MIYLIQNESRHLIDERIKDIIKDDTNIIVCDYLTEGLDYILEEASYLSLFDEKKYIIVRNAIFFAKKLNETDNEKLKSYLNNPNSNTILIFTLNDKVDERSKVVKIIKEKYTYNVIPKLSPKEIINRIINYFKNNKMNISFDNARYIADSCLNNYDLLINEIAKILLYYNDKGGEVKTEDIINLTSKNIEKNIFKYSDAVIKKDFKKMFNLFNDLKLIKEEPTVLINILAREYRMILKVITLIENKTPKNEISRLLSLPDWLLDKVIQNSYNYRIEEVKEKIVNLSKLDLSIKNGRIDKYLGIELFMLDL